MPFQLIIEVNSLLAGQLQGRERYGERTLLRLEHKLINYTSRLALQHPLGVSRKQLELSDFRVDGGHLSVVNSTWVEYQRALRGTHYETSVAQSDRCRGVELSPVYSEEPVHHHRPAGRRVKTIDLPLGHRHDIV